MDPVKRIGGIERYTFNHKYENGYHLNTNSQLCQKLFKDWETPNRDYNMLSSNYNMYEKALNIEYEKSKKDPHYFVSKNRINELMSKNS